MQDPTSQLGTYELLHRLGTGGMAETYEARRRGPAGFEQRVCLKRILPGFSQESDFIDLFLSEAKIAAKLRHANIVQIIELGVTDHTHFMALELVEGVDLRRLLKDCERLDWQLVSYLAHELGAALEFAHQVAIEPGKVGVVHRDISPSNVLLSLAGEVKLADFGIAKALSTTQGTRTGSIKGKVAYMAPEYAAGGHFDVRSDLFSLGVTLYEALAGTRPFDGANEVDTFRRIQDAEYRPFEGASLETPAALRNAIERLLCKGPDDRFQTAGDFLDALTELSPTPAARRRLGELVRSAQPPAPPAEPIGELSTEALVPKDTTPPTAAARVEASRTQTRSTHRGDSALPVRTAIAVTFVLVCLVVFVRSLWSSEPLDTAAGPVADGNPAPPTVLTESASASSDRQPSAPLPDEPSAPPPEETPPTVTSPVEHNVRQVRHAGRLQIIVLPYGKVWIDGKSYGSAPVDVMLPAGRHRIRALSGAKKKLQTAIIKSKRRKRVVFKFND